MITWSQFFGTMAVLLVVYYAYVALVYYRAEVLDLFTGQKDKAAGAQALPTPPASLLNRGPLLPKAAVVLPTPADLAPANEEAPPATEAVTDEPGEELGEETVVKVSALAPDQAEDEAQQEINEATDEEPQQNQGNDYGNKENSIIRNSINLAEAESDDLAPPLPVGVQGTVEVFEENFTVSVSQLNNVFERAAAGEVTQQQLTKEVPALAGTQVLEAFYQRSKKSAQQLTAATYIEVAEPA
ncbi:hypothetical protein [Hymenobacter qilianensis]|uniref:Uncharacterized protein n=1 Tax=Hymenobacter qilianensis TaxID=1385715 RepID=A0A7H0H1L8_9BACT|nr:hypothetical protein [Hymenobacter qilianensis]QNP54434.1 hypothetical protein H9L05_21925 [Hymenobacter qilianensis]